MSSERFARQLFVRRVGPLLEAQHLALLAARRAVDDAQRAQRAQLQHLAAARPEHEPGHRPGSEFVVVTFYTEGRPHDAGLPLQPQAEQLRATLAPHCDRFLAFSLRQVRTMVLRDGSRCATLARDLREEVARARGGVPPNSGYAAIGFGAARPCFILHVLEKMREGGVLFYLDVNVAKHWSMCAPLPNLPCPLFSCVFVRERESV
jgi:hypothetical protein